MRLQNWHHLSLQLLYLLISTTYAHPLSSSESLNSTSPSLSTDTFDTFIDLGLTRIRNIYGAQNPQPFNVNVVKKRNPYKITARIDFTYTNLRGVDGAILFSGSARGAPYGTLHRPAGLPLVSFDWEHKPLGVEEAIDLVRGTESLDEVVREMTFDDLKVRVSWRIPGIADGLMVYRFERREVYVVYVKMVARQVVLGRARGVEGGGNGTDFDGVGGCDGGDGDCLDHVDEIV